MKVDIRTLLKQSVAAMRLLLCSVIQIAPNHKQLLSVTMFVLQSSRTTSDKFFATPGKILLGIPIVIMQGGKKKS